VFYRRGHHEFPLQAHHKSKTPALFQKGFDLGIEERLGFLGDLLFLEDL
jgi:hypothetical protein